MPTPVRHRRRILVLLHSYFTLGTKWNSVVITSWPLYLWERTPEPTKRRLSGPPQTNWTFQRKAFLAPTGIRTPDRPARSPVTILNATPTPYMDNTILKWIFREHGGRMQIGLICGRLGIRYRCCEQGDELYFVLWPTNAQLFYKLSHPYMFRHYRVILRELGINTLPSYTSMSNAAVGNTIYN
jgi:hypothetical protein